MLPDGTIHHLGMMVFSCLFKNSLISFPNNNKSCISLVRELHSMSCQDKMTTQWWSFYFVKHPDENRRFDTIVGKNKRNALRTVRALRVVSATNNPSGAAKIINDPNGSFFILPKVPRRIRQSANGTHGEYADKQLANPQKRICYIRVFAWRLIIVYQGGEWGCQNNK